MREQTDPMLSNHSRGTVMSYTDHSAWDRFKSNKPFDMCSDSKQKIHKGFEASQISDL